MTTYKRPGTYVEEVNLPQIVTSQGLDVALGAFVGAALRGPVDSPVYVGSWTDFTRRFGTFRSAAGTSTFRLALAVYQFFSNGGRGAWINRVVGAGADNATIALNDASSGGAEVLDVTALDPGDWALTNLYIQVTDVVPTGTGGATVDNDKFAINVFNGGSSQGYIVERWTDLSLDPSDTRYAVDVINASSSWLSVARPDGATSKKPPVEQSVPVALTKPVGVTASLDGAAVSATTLTDAAAEFDVVTSNLVFNIPDAYDLGDSDAATVANAYLLYADARGDAFVVVDVPKGSESTAAGAQTWVASVSGTGNGAVYFPSVTITNPIQGTSGRNLTVAPGGAVVGMFQRIDSSRGVFKSPAGVAATLSNVVDVAYRLTPQEQDTLNTSTKPLNAIRFVPSTGICVMGARTLAGSQPLRYVATRRTMHTIKKTLTELTSFAVFENNDWHLWEKVNTTVSTYLSGLWQAGGLKGSTPTDAFYVLCDQSNNTTQSINEGVLNVEVGVALQTPAEFVVIKIGQFDGGTSVTEEA